jgi:hypothetical protein
VIVMAGDRAEAGAWILILLADRRAAEALFQRKLIAFNRRIRESNARSRQLHEGIIGRGRSRSCISRQNGSASSARRPRGCAVPLFRARSARLGALVSTVTMMSSLILAVVLLAGRASDGRRG